MIMIDPVILSTVASFMMNGVCCVYQMNSEKELREAIRKDIRDEWDNIRQEERSNHGAVNVSSFDQASVGEEKVVDAEYRQGVTRRRSTENKAEARKQIFLDRMTSTNEKVYIDCAYEPTNLAPKSYAPLRRPHEAPKNPKKLPSLFDEEFLEEDPLEPSSAYSPSLFPSQ